ncbi:MAG: hypothetical protein ABR601_07575 [Parasphingopyxis sp.]|nr:hypothetical protein [Sphingomonadales bacterium]
MRILILGVATVALAGCGGTSVRDQAVSECARQAEQSSAALQAAGVDPDEFCACITEEIDENSTLEEANAAITSRTQMCIAQNIQQ